MIKLVCKDTHVAQEVKKTCGDAGVVSKIIDRAIIINCNWSDRFAREILAKFDCYILSVVAWDKEYLMGNIEI